MCAAVSKAQKEARAEICTHRDKQKAFRCHVLPASASQEAMAHLQMALEEGPFLPHLSLLAALNGGGNKLFPLTRTAGLLQICEFGSSLIIITHHHHPDHPSSLSYATSSPPAASLWGGARVRDGDLCLSIKKLAELWRGTNCVDKLAKEIRKISGFGGKGFRRR